MSFYSVARKCLGGFFRTIYRVKVTGLENEPMEGPVIVCANHLSNLDVIVMGATLKRPVRFFAKAELFRYPVLKQIVKALGAVPVERQVATNAAAAIKGTLKLLEDGPPYHRGQGRCGSDRLPLQGNRSAGSRSH